MIGLPGMDCPGDLCKGRILTGDKPQVRILLR